MSENRTVWFEEPIEHSGRRTDSLVVEDVDDLGDRYELRVPDGETITVSKEQVDRIE